MTATVVRADARHLPLPDGSVDLVVTSPPYFGLRSYTDGGEHYDGQIGSEETPRQWLEALWACTAEWMRVLKPGGSIFVNLGDKYAGGDASPRWHHSRPERQPTGKDAAKNIAAPPPACDWGGARPKSLLGLPWRYALGCVDDLGLILRAEIVWAKPNGLPESVTDRVRRAHEQVFHFTKQPRYYAAVDEIRESYSDRVQDRQRYAQRDIPPSKGYAPQNRNDADRARGILGFGADGTNPLGKLPGSVWEIPSQPLTVPAHLGVDHFAAFPMELPRRIILGWSPPGICTACGEGRRPVVMQVSEDYAALRAEIRTDARAQFGDAGVAQGAESRGRRSGRTNRHSKAGSLLSNGVVTADKRVTGYACACPDATAPTRPAVVADPFSGTGTTALVASMYGRLGLSFDLSADYCRLARWRTRDPAERARALGVAKPPPVPDGQGDLFAEVS